MCCVSTAFNCSRLVKAHTVAAFQRACRTAHVALMHGDTSAFIETTVTTPALTPSLTDLHTQAPTPAPSQSQPALARTPVPPPNGIAADQRSRTRHANPTARHVSTTRTRNSTTHTRPVAAMHAASQHPVSSMPPASPALTTPSHAHAHAQRTPRRRHRAAHPARQQGVTRVSANQSPDSTQMSQPVL